MLLCQRFGDSCLLLRVSVTKWQSIRVYLSFKTLQRTELQSFNLLFRNPIQLNLSFELGLQKMFMLFERSILEILKRRSNVFASKFLLRLWHLRHLRYLDSKLLKHRWWYGHEKCRSNIFWRIPKPSAFPRTISWIPSEFLNSRTRNQMVLEFFKNRYWLWYWLS